MASNKGQYRIEKEWAKHLRANKSGNPFWKGERKLAKNAIKQNKEYRKLEIAYLVIKRLYKYSALSELYWSSH